MSANFRRQFMLLFILLTALQAFAPRELVMCFAGRGNGALEHGSGGRCLGAVIQKNSECAVQTAPEAPSSLAATNSGCLDVVLATLDARRPESGLRAPDASAYALATTPATVQALSLLPTRYRRLYHTPQPYVGYTARLLTTLLRV